MIDAIEIAVVFAVAIVAAVAAYSIHSRALAREVERSQRERSATLARSCPPVAAEDPQAIPAPRALAPVLRFSAAQIAWTQRSRAERSQTEHVPVTIAR